MDDVELIRRHAPQVAPPDPARKQQSRVALMTTALAPTRRVPWPALPARRTAVVAVALALAAVVVVGGPLSFLSRNDPAAAAALQRAAIVAAQRRALELGDGYLYTKTDALWSFSTMDWVYLRPLLRETWVAADGSGRIREEIVGDLIFLSEADRRAWEADAIEADLEVYALNEDFGPGGLEPFLDYASLPTEVDVLREVVSERAAASHPWPRTDGQIFVVIRDLLREPMTPPDVRAALFEVAAGLPGIELLGEMSDRIGRQGVAVAMTELAMTPFARQQIVIFDPVTSVLLEERTVGLWPYGDTPAPFDWGYSTYLEFKVVPELPAE